MGPKQRCILVGDIGGTKTALAIVTVDRGPRQPVVERTFLSERYTRLDEIIMPFLRETGFTPQAACFGVAGPVIKGQVRITNLPWLVDAAELSTILGIPVHLLNDLESIAQGVPLLEQADLETINRGEAIPHGALAVIAPGTGLGEAFLVWDGQSYRAYSSEGGHCSFSPTTPIQIELLTYLLQRYDHVSVERVCSGLGIPNIYMFLRDSGRAEEPLWLQQALAAGVDPTPVLVTAGLEKKAAIAEAMLDLFIDILACEASNLALKVLATGGVFLGGGISPRIVPVLRGKAFMEAFTRKGRFTSFLTRIPIHVILEPKVALFGAARYGLHMIGAEEGGGKQ